VPALHGDQRVDQSMRMAPRLARDQRIAFCNNVGLTLLSIGVIFTGQLRYSALLPAIFAEAPYS
jgi:hypothetical protein